jgi:hypothetical protein
MKGGKSSDRGGKRGNYKSYAQTKKASNYPAHAEEKERSKLQTELPKLAGRQPNSAHTMQWLTAMHAHASQHFSRHGIHWLLHPTMAQEPAAPVLPVRPVRANYAIQGQDDEFDEGSYKLDLDLYKQDMGKHKEKLEEIRQDKIRMFNFLVTHVEEETKNTIATRKEPGIFSRENPKELIDAIKVLFLGHVVGTIGNSFDVTDAERRFLNLEQRLNQTAAEFKIIWDRELAAVMASLRSW